MNGLLLIVLALLIWGPPRLRVDPRPLEVSLTDPLNIDFVALLQVVVWLLGGVIVLFCLLSRGTRRPPLPRAMRSGPLTVYLIYCCYALLSVGYSLNPPYTLFFAAKLLIALFACSLLLNAYEPLESMRKLLGVFYAVNVVQWLAIVVCYYTNPALVGKQIPGVGYRLNAVLFGDFGVSAVVSGLFFLSRVTQPLGLLQRLFFALLYVSSLYFVYLSRTRSSIACAVVFFFLFVGLDRRRWIKAAMFLGCVAVAVFALAGEFEDDVFAYLMRGQRMQAILSLTGRTTAFGYLASIWEESPIWGHGYAAGSRGFLLSFVYEYRLGIGAAHDALSKVLVDLGIAGLSLLGLTIAYGFIELARAWKRCKGSAPSRELCQHAIALFAASLLSSAVSGGVADLCFPLTIALGCFTLLRSVGVSTVRVEAPLVCGTMRPHVVRSW